MELNLVELLSNSFIVHAQFKLKEINDECNEISINKAQVCINLRQVKQASSPEYTD